MKEAFCAYVTLKKGLCFDILKTYVDCCLRAVQFLSFMSIMFLNLSENRKRKIYNTRRSSTNYKTLYRFSEDHVEWIASEFLGQSHETRGGALSNHQRMQSFLRYMSDPGYQV